MVEILRDLFEALQKGKRYVFTVFISTTALCVIAFLKPETPYLVSNQYFWIVLIISILSGVLAILLAFEGIAWFINRVAHAYSCRSLSKSEKLLLLEMSRKPTDWFDLDTYGVRKGEKEIETTSTALRLEKKGLIRTEKFAVNAAILTDSGIERAIDIANKLN